jgi:undecaprenyl-diphosphatase
VPHGPVVDIAQDGLYLIALGALLVWLFVPLGEKVLLAVQVVVALVVAAVLIKVAAAVHSDPRPFVANPHLHPWFAHARDDGFPSDHTTIGATVAFVVLAHRRLVGALLVLLAIAVGVARVLAHVHHAEDIVAGVVIGLVAAGVGLLSSPLGRRAAVRATQLRSRGARRTAHDPR